MFAHFGRHVCLMLCGGVVPSCHQICLKCCAAVVRCVAHFSFHEPHAADVGGVVVGVFFCSVLVLLHIEGRERRGVIDSYVANCSFAWQEVPLQSCESPAISQIAYPHHAFGDCRKADRVEVDGFH